MNDYETSFLLKAFSKGVPRTFRIRSEETEKPNRE